MQNADKAFLLGKTVAQLVFYNATRTNENTQVDTVEFLKGYTRGYAEILKVDIDVDAILQADGHNPKDTGDVWRAYVGGALAAQSELLADCFDLGFEFTTYVTLKGGYPLSERITQEMANALEQRLRRRADQVGLDQTYLDDLVEAVKDSSMSEQVFQSMQVNTMEKIAGYFKKQSEDSPPLTQSQIVLLIHGIRTQGAWQEMVAENLEEENLIKVFPLGFGYLDGFSFWFPFLTRERAIRQVLRRVRYAHNQYPNAHMSVIAHSFGTYAIGKILQDNPDIHIYRLILCGSILNSDFRWDQLRNQIEGSQEGKIGVINECGTRDIWPILARSSTWGCGDAGSFGFRTVTVRDRFHDYYHGDYFTAEFVKKFWVPFIKTGQVIRSEWDGKRQPPPWWMSFLSIFPLRYFILLILALLIYLGAIGIFHH